MYFQLIPVNGALWVEGESSEVGEFHGYVTAIGLRDYDPVASPQQDRGTDTHVEGMWGWGTTHFLVCDVDKPTPVWVVKEDVRRHAFDCAGVGSQA